MAIPNRTTITCPNCGASERLIIADSSVGPKGRVSDTPLYSIGRSDLWTQNGRGPDGTISCKTCGTADFITLRDQVRMRSAAR